MLGSDGKYLEALVSFELEQRLFANVKRSHGKRNLLAFSFINRSALR